MNTVQPAIPAGELKVVFYNKPTGGQGYYFVVGDKSFSVDELYTHNYRCTPENLSTVIAHVKDKASSNWQDQEINGILNGFRPIDKVLMFTDVKQEFKEMFTVGKQYPVLSVSPNGVLVTVTDDEGQSCLVQPESSIYGKAALK